MQNPYSWGCSVSFVFKATSDRQVGTRYMDYEIAEGFEPFWIAFDDFIAKQASKEGKIESYGKCFSNRRDLEIARYFKEHSQAGS